MAGRNESRLQERERQNLRRQKCKRKRKLLREAAILIAVSRFTVFDATPAAADPAFSFDFIRPAGDVYNERTTDGDAYPQSLALRAQYVRGAYALRMDYWRNVYLTDSDGPGSLTKYPRIEGGYGLTPPFLARETSFESRLERAINHRSLYAGIGVDRTWTNYNYPSLTGVGAGIEQLAAKGPGIRPFGSIFYYPSASGTYTTETPPAAILDLHYRILKLDYGFIAQGRRFPVYFVAGYGNEFRRANGIPNAQIRFIRSDVYFGFGTHF
jgi:hypothetical protein